MCYDRVWTGERVPVLTLVWLYESAGEKRRLVQSVDGTPNMAHHWQ